MSYATLDEFKEWVSEGSLFDGSQDAQLQMVLDAVDRAVDRYCGRHFTLEINVTKYFYPQSTDELQVTDLVTIDTMLSDTRGDRSFTLAFDPEDYELLPYVDSMGSEAERFDLIRIWPTSSHSFSPGRLVEITGDFGYIEAGGTPPDVKTACLILGARWWKRREAPLGILNNVDLGQFDRLTKEDPDVLTLLSPYSTSIRGGWVAV